MTYRWLIVVLILGCQPVSVPYRGSGHFPRSAADRQMAHLVDRFCRERLRLQDAEDPRAQDAYRDYMIRLAPIVPSDLSAKRAAQHDVLKTHLVIAESHDVGSATSSVAPSPDRAWIQDLCSDRAP